MMADKRASKKVFRFNYFDPKIAYIALSNNTLISWHDFERETIFGIDKKNTPDKRSVCRGNSNNHFIDLIQTQELGNVLDTAKNHILTLPNLIIHKTNHPAFEMVFGDIFGQELPRSPCSNNENILYFHSSPNASVISTHFYNRKIFIIKVKCLSQTFVQVYHSDTFQ